MYRYRFNVFFFLQMSVSSCLSARFFFCSLFSVQILLVNRLSKAEMTPHLMYTDLVAHIRSSCGVFFCSWLTCGIAWLDCGPDLANRSGPPKGRHSMMHVDQISFPPVPEMGQIWAQKNIAIWGCSDNKNNK